MRGYWCGRTSFSPVPRTLRMLSCGTRSKQRCARTSHALHPTPRWSAGTAATSASRATTTMAGVRPSARGRTGGAATTTDCCPRSWPSSIRPGRTFRRARFRRLTMRVRAPPTAALFIAGRCGTVGTTRPIATRSRDSSPSSDSRGRRTTRPWSAACTMTRSHPTRPACSHTRRPTTGKASCAAAMSRICRRRPASTTGISRRS